MTRLKHFCDEAGIAYEKLLGYGRTRFLAFRGCIDRIISQFEPLKSFFLNPNETTSPPKLVKFFNCPIALLILIFVRDQYQLFEDSIKKLEGDTVTGFTAFEIMDQLKAVIEHRLNDRFSSFAFREELAKVKDNLPFEITIKKANNYVDVLVDQIYLDRMVKKFFTDCIEYLNKWLEPLQPLKIWSWACLRKIPDWKDIEPCMDAMFKEKLIVESDDVKMHTEFCNVKSIIEYNMLQWENENSATEKRWLDVFASLVEKDISFNVFLKLIEYGMAIPGKSISMSRKQIFYF